MGPSTPEKTSSAHGFAPSDPLAIAQMTLVHWAAYNELSLMQTIDITYRYEATDTARPSPPNSAAALSRLNEGNRAFAALLDPTDESVEHIISVDQRDLGL